MVAAMQVGFTATMFMRGERDESIQIVNNGTVCFLHFVQYKGLCWQTADKQKHMQTCCPKPRMLSRILGLASCSVEYVRGKLISII